jgi:hypothetical protein
MRERGWTQALSPAAVNLLLFCGTEASNLDAVLDRVWDQLARPRARADLRTPEGVGPGMDRAMEQLTDIDLQRADVDPPELDSGHNGGETSDADRPSPAAGQPRGIARRPRRNARRRSRPTRQPRGRAWQRHGHGAAGWGW